MGRVEELKSSLSLINKIVELKDGRKGKVLSTLNAFTVKGLKLTGVKVENIGEVSIKEIKNIES